MAGGQELQGRPATEPGFAEPTSQMVACMTCGTAARRLVLKLGGAGGTAAGRQWRCGAGCGAGRQGTARHEGLVQKHALSVLPLIGLPSLFPRPAAGRAELRQHAAAAVDEENARAPRAARRLCILLKPAGDQPFRQAACLLVVEVNEVVGGPRNP